MGRCRALRLAAPQGLHRAARRQLDISSCQAHPLGSSRPLLLLLEAWPAAQACMQLKGSTQRLCQRRCVPDASCCCALLRIMTRSVASRKLRLCVTVQNVPRGSSEGMGVPDMVDQLRCDDDSDSDSLSSESDEPDEDFHGGGEPW